MLNLIKSILLLFVISMFTSCSEMNQKLEEKLNELSGKTEYLDSLVTKEIEKVTTLDSIIILEGNKIKELDSLVNKASSKIDSITNEKN